MSTNNKPLANGGLMGQVYDLTDEAADTFCALETKRTGLNHTWVRTRGLVHVKVEPTTKESN